jgi:CHAT domain-containing protein
MPALADRSVSVTPSAAQWVRSRTTTEPAGSRVVLVAGPRLAGGEHEVEQLRRIYPEAVVLTGTAATVDRTLREIEGAALVHFASHGTFRSDNPMFSSLSLHDGPLTVHDLGRLRKPPFRMVLPACDSGIGSHTGSDELLGLASALVGLGTAGLASSVSQVNDRATVPVMVAIHSSLRDGRTLPTALAAARRTVADGSDLQRATAASFVAFGV